jgi:hypothetical protein
LEYLELTSKQLTDGQIAEQMNAELKATGESTNYLGRSVCSVKSFSLPVARGGSKWVAPQRR